MVLLLHGHTLFSWSSAFPRITSQPSRCANSFLAWTFMWKVRSMSGVETSLSKDCAALLNPMTSASTSWSNVSQVWNSDDGHVALERKKK